jgi:hypothetical protein
MSNIAGARRGKLSQDQVRNASMDQRVARPIGVRGEPELIGAVALVPTW